MRSFPSSSNAPLDGDRLLGNRDLLFCLLQRLINNIPYAAAARHFHVGDRDGFDRVKPEDLAEFFDVSFDVRDPASGRR